MCIRDSVGLYCFPTFNTAWKGLRSSWRFFRSLVLYFAPYLDMVRYWSKILFDDLSGVDAIRNSCTRLESGKLHSLHGVVSIILCLAVFFVELWLVTDRQTVGHTHSIYHASTASHGKNLTEVANLFHSRQTTISEDIIGDIQNVQCIVSYSVITWRFLQNTSKL